jgi:hypothetical protein
MSESVYKVIELVGTSPESIAHKLRYSPLCQAPCCVLRRFG